MDSMSINNVGCSCLFDQDVHWWMLYDIKVLTPILLPLVVPTPFTDKVNSCAASSVVVKEQLRFYEGKRWHGSGAMDASRES